MIILGNLDEITIQPVCSDRHIHERWRKYNIIEEVTNTINKPLK